MRILFSQKLVFISKPRCGSTSIRRLLTPQMSESQGDISVDIAGQLPPFHPHMPAPYLKAVLRQRHVNVDDLTFIVTIRNPVSMLWSYYNYFKPDRQSKYNFSPEWEGEVGMGFEDWIVNGKIGMNPEWQELAPDWISTDDLSPLSLEAHVQDSSGHAEVDFIFRLEEMRELEDWLAVRIGAPQSMPSVNHSSAQDKKAPQLCDDAMRAVRIMFPVESRMYGV